MAVSKPVPHRGGAPVYCLSF
uniref:Uncharacterized protein n=1 Tax=Anguilla anguilla TaxID=7936 RepID=A0A0E9QN50_ANGAN